ncbi:MAG TPA: hypothetical protein VHD38_03335 [Candidatus Paceibacterota bacterium]|jgi:hypothetical protein|nr:hypothetical protein [Candidatus Paceibacterota bacterium]
MQQLLHALSIDAETLFFALETSGRIVGMSILILGPAVLIARFSS